MNNIRAVKEFNEYGYKWYPQIWVEALQRWFDIQSVRHFYPEGFKSSRDAIQIGIEHTQ